MRNRTDKYRIVYVSLFLVLLYLPILCVVLYSFNASKSTAHWQGFTLDWYRELFSDRRIIDSFLVSLQVGLMTSALSAVLGTLFAVLSQFVKKGMRKLLGNVMIFPLLVPEVALGISLLMFFVLTPLPFGRVTLVISHSVFCVPYVYMMVNLRLQNIDRSIIEAARDLGASTTQIFRTILLPLITPAILSGSLLSLAMSLDDVVISTYMSGPSSTTLPVHIFSMMKVGVTPEVNALCTLILVATFFIVGILQFSGTMRRGEN